MSRATADLAPTVTPLGALSSLERNARSSARAALRWGATWTAFLCVLPGMLSRSPVENAAAGTGAGAAATLLAAAGVYLWRSYVTPYCRVRAMIRASAALPQPLPADRCQVLGRRTRVGSTDAARSAGRDPVGAVRPGLRDHRAAGLR